MSQAKKGDTVRVDYGGKLESGEVFDRGPLELTLGAGQVIPGFEKAIEGMSPGDSKSVDVEAAEAYGQRHADKILEFARDTLPANLALQVGQQVPLQTQDERVIKAVVTGVSESAVTVDANHPLAGRDLTFDIELIEIL